MRNCRTCQHLKRPDIGRRLAAGEPAAQVARSYELNPSSLYRHRVNCLKLGPSNAIMKETARGTAAVALLPSKETLSGAYFELRGRIDQIVAQAQAEGSLSVAITGLNSLRQTLDSLSRLAGHDRASRFCGQWYANWQRRTRIRPHLRNDANRSSPNTNANATEGQRRY
jgi:hypothetical protein